jgi:drug/metabolite transporter (DMT)-like permease
VRATSRLYLYLILYVLLSAVRDVFASHASQSGFLKNVSPGVLLFSGSLITICFCSKRFMFELKTTSIVPNSRERLACYWHLALLGLSTLIAYFFYVKATLSTLSPGLVSFIDYTLSPLFSIVFAFSFLAERPSKKFFVSFIAGISGLFLLLKPRFTPSFDSAILYAPCISALAGASFRIFLKRCYSLGFSTRFLAVFRLLPVAIVFSLSFFSALPFLSFSQFVFIFAWGLLGFTIPILLFMKILESHSIGTFGVLLLMVPTATHILATLVSRQPFPVSDYLAITLILVSIILVEKKQISPG